jgi:amidase
MIKSSAFVPHDLKAPLKGAPSGPLAGLTCVVKDMYDIAGEVCGGGNPTWLATHQPATVHSDAVARVLGAGATITGKTICEEFFYSVLGMNVHYGTPVNPRTPNRIPGGSSSGSVVAVAAGAADFALGSDTGGSVRIPAQINGIYGMRVTHGRMSLKGAMPMAPTFDTGGWFTASAGLLRKVGVVMLEGASAVAPVDKVVKATDVLALAQPNVAAVFTRFEKRIAGMMPTATNVVMASEGFETWRDTFRVIQAREVWENYGAWLESNPEAKPGPGIKERLAAAKTVTEASASSARQHMTTIRHHIRDMIRPGTILLMPTAPSVAPLLSAPAAELDAYRPAVMTYTCIAGLGGLPQVQIPAGNADGVPVGVSLVGWRGADEVLLDLAVTLSTVNGD